MPALMIKLLTRADIISVLNVSFGFLAILAVLYNEQRLAFTLILLALLADGLDGMLARRFGSGKMGEYLEAMGDMVSLAIAPIFFVQFFTEKTVVFWDTLFIFLLIVSMFYLICSIIRLASFHVFKEQRHFIGLPASVSTILLICLVELNIQLYIILIAMICVAIAMISPIKFMKPSKEINSIAALLILASIGMYTSFSKISLFLLFGGMIIYTITAPLNVSIFKKNK